MNKTTEKNYNRMMNSLKNKYKIEDFNDYKNVIKILKNNLKDYSIKTYMCAIINYIEDEKLKAIYQKQMNAFGNSYNKKVLDNELTENQINSFIGYDKLLEIYIFCYKKNAYADALIIALYTFFPPRRLEYCGMVIKDNKPKEMDMSMNYYINKRNGYFIFNNYKTSRKYKTQIFEVPQDLDIIIKQYIYYEAKQDGDVLIDIKGRQHFTERINKAIQTIEPGKNVGVQILRHSFLTYLYNRNDYKLPFEPQFLKGRKNGVRTARLMAKMMAHTIEQQFNYVKHV